MPNIKKNMVNAIVKRTKKLSILLILVMLFSSVLNSVIIAEKDPKPDLTFPVDDGVVVSGDIVEGEEITFEATILNQEDVDISSNIKVGLFFADQLDTPIYIANIPSGLPGNDQTSVNLYWDASPGFHMFKVIVDYPNEILEEDENNNVQVLSLDVSERNTDLTFVYEDEMIIDGERRVGSQLTISATAINTGKNTSQDIAVGLYINDDKNQESIINGLSKGETYPISFEWTPEHFGDYNISIKLDYENSIPEQDNSNNHIYDNNVTIDITNLSWWNANWHYRKFYEVEGIGNLSININFTVLLNELHIFNNTFENDTIQIVKYTKVGNVSDFVSNYSFNESEDFDNETNAYGNLTWTVNESLYYCIYFDVKENEGVRISMDETHDLNTSGTSPNIVFEASAEGWWSYQYGTFKNYYLPYDDQMFIQINTTAIADNVVANFYYQENFTHSIVMESDDNLTWNNESTFSDIGDWRVVIVSEDKAGYQSENISYLFYVGKPDFTVTNITFSSDVTGSSPFYEGYNINIDADVTVYNTTVNNVTVSLEINNTEVYSITNLTILKNENNIVRFDYTFDQFGTYEVKVEINPNGSIVESNYNNNNFSKTINISGIPDLGVVNVSVPTKYFDEGDRIEIFAIVNNTGNENAIGYQVNLYFEKNGNEMTYNEEKNHIYVDLAIDETKNISLIWDYAEPGEWFVGVKILQSPTKPDSNFLNNDKSRLDVSLKVNATEQPETNAPVIEILEPEPLEKFEQNLPVKIIAKITDESSIESVNVTITLRNRTSYTFDMIKQDGDKYSYIFENTHILNTYNFKIIAVDEYNNTKAASSKFTIVEDATPPEIEYIGVLPSVQLKDGDVTISSIVSDRSGVKFVQVTITYPDGSSETKNMTNSSGDKKYYFTQSYEMLGRYVFYITTEDALENKKTTKNEEVDFWITIDLEDTDSDGMPDWWEEKYGFDPFDPTDADEDEDDDGYTNVEEYEDGTNPLKPLSLLERIVNKSKENWIYALVSGILFIVLIALSMYGFFRRKA